MDEHRGRRIGIRCLGACIAPSHQYKELWIPSNYQETTRVCIPLELSPCDGASEISPAMERETHTRVSVSRGLSL